MPKKGFKSITVSEKTHGILNEYAKSKKRPVSMSCVAETAIIMALEKKLV